MGTWTWYGASGQNYQFGTFNKHDNWNDVPGIYLFVRSPMLLASSPYPTPLYVGQCDSFSSRVCGHERWGDALLHGANAVHAMVVRWQADRDYIERDLIATLKPALNTHFAGLVAP